MKIFRLSVSLVVAASFLSGCINTARIKETHLIKDNKGNLVVSPSQKVEGIPFKIKKAVYNQSTQYSQTWLKVSLIIQEISSDPTQKPTQSSPIQKMIEKTKLSELDEVKKAIFRSNKNVEDVDKIIELFGKITAVTNLSEVEKSLIANTIKSEWVVDDSKTYYLNSPLPWFGTNNITQKLNTDMTLSEVSLAPDTKLADGLSALIPLKEYLTGKFVKSTSATSSNDAVANDSSDKKLNTYSLFSKKPEIIEKTKITYNVSLEITEVGYIYTFTKPITEPIFQSPIPFDPNNYQFTRQPISAASSDKEEKEDDGQLISIKGMITLPKAEVAPK